MGLLAAGWLLAFACLLVALLSDGLLPVLVADALADIALAMLSLVITCAVAVWLPDFGLSRELRAIARTMRPAVMLCRLRGLRLRLVIFSQVVCLLALACLLVAILGEGVLAQSASAALACAALGGLLSSIACILFGWDPVHKVIGDLLRAKSGRSGATSYLLNFASYAPLSDSPPPRSTH
ncbi:MAG: hypothetical protein H6R19_2692 [Proteobacteria bacterium]|nr:hypothetical protein [Pseudomonadota bacterium]